ncbi:MAG: vWA domain-containing protein [Pseudomonadota bacterium]
MRKGAGRVVAAVLLLSLAPTGALRAEDPASEALLMEGKTNLFQRVLTRPGAILLPARDAESGGSPISPFSVFYVYERDGTGAPVAVGARPSGGPDGWLAADKVIAWKQSIVVAFTNSAGRERALLYSDQDALLDVMESETVVEEVRAHRETALSGALPPDFPVLSVEPATPVDIEEEFYLLPILEAEEVYLSSGFSARLLGIASVTRDEVDEEESLQNDAIREAVAKVAPRGGEALKDLKYGVVFVIDTTTSMEPYIHSTREAVRRISTTLADQALGDRLRFGLVGFRDDLGAVPALDYVSQVFAAPDESMDFETFLAEVEAVTAATVSSKGFVEDSIAGISTAITSIDWEGFDARVVVLITDAGARRSDDPLSATGLGANEVRALARLNGVELFALHLLTEAGAANHAAARRQYEALSADADGTPRYYGVEAGDVDTFSRTLDWISQGLNELIAASASGTLIEEPQEKEAAADAGALPPPLQEDPALRDLVTSVRKTGLALQLEYLGSREGSKAPTVFEAWIADRALENPDTATLSVRLLMTKAQLSDLQDRLRLILEAGELGKASPQDFFAMLQSAAASMARDPSRIATEEATTLGQTGILGEYLEGLPYQSKVLSIQANDWLNRGIGEQDAFLAEIEAKIRLYESFHDDSDAWVALESGDVPGERVYPVPLDALP